MNVRPTLAALSIAAVALFGSVACGTQQDPCRFVEVDNEQALAKFASDNPQIEIEAEGENDAECILTGGGNWVDEANFDDEGEDD